MAQLLLIPDPRPLVELLGRDFFRQAPECPGVYLMRDAAETVLYVGKAKNLRKRLASYRVANPDRLPRRHLRLLRAVARIEFQSCADESTALAREAELLRTLRPRFNRAGTWPGLPRFLAWRITDHALDFAVMSSSETGWNCHGPLGSARAQYLRASLTRLLWCAFYPERGLAGLPEGWFSGRHGERTSIPCRHNSVADLKGLEPLLNSLMAGNPAGFEAWINDRLAPHVHPFETTAREADLDLLRQLATRPVPMLPAAQDHS